jgi:hypothetical protein
MSFALVRRTSILAACLLASVAVAAQPLILWTDGPGATVGIRQAPLAGGAAQEFAAVGGKPVALASDGTFLYWTDGSRNTIGRAALDGTNPQPSFVQLSGTPGEGLATDGAFLYWSTGSTIGRVRLDGTGANEQFITRLASPGGVTSDGTYLYWTSAFGSIGRANLDGSNVRASFVSTFGTPRDVVAGNTHLYWTNSDLGTIERAPISGGSARTVVSGLTAPRGITADNTYLYWTDSEADAIGRANLDGTNVNASFVSTRDTPIGLLVTTGTDVLPVELTAFTAQLDGPDARLRWSTASETDNSGFQVEHALPGHDFVRAGWVSGRGTTLEASTYSFAVPGLAPGTHRFRLRQTDLDGAETLSPVVELAVGLDRSSRLAVSPLPASSAAGVIVQVRRAQPVQVAIYDALGREVARLFDGVLEADRAQHLPLDASSLAPGRYVVRLVGPYATQTQPLIVAR